MILWNQILIAEFILEDGFPSETGNPSKYKFGC
jgi:hypothetical protein